MKHLLLIIFLLFAAGQMQAQSDGLIDIEKELLQMEQDVAEGKLKLSEAKYSQKYLNLMYYFHTRDIEKTHLYFQKALTFLRKHKDVANEALVLIQMGDFYSTWGKTDSADIFFNEALKVIEGKELYREESILHQYRGSNFAIVNDVQNAMNEFLKALEMNEKDKLRNIADKKDISKNIHQEADILCNISGIYYNMSNLDKAKEYLLRVQKIVDDNRDIDILLFFDTHIAGNLSQIYWEKGEYEEAFPLMEKFYKIAKEEDILEYLVNASQRLADYYRIVDKDFDKALTFANEALETANQTQQPYKINVAERSLMSIYISLKDYKTALRYAESVLARCKEDDWESLENVYGELVRIYAFMGEMNKSDEYQVKHRNITAKMSDKNLHSALQEMEVKYEVEQKEQAHRAEISRHKTRQNIFIAGLLVAGLLLALLVYIVSLRNRRNRELAEMNATKDKFFSIISHDLKNPAIAQRNAIQMLFENAEHWDVEALSKYYKGLLHSADHQIELLYNLLNWAQVQTGRMPYYPAQFNLVVALQSDIALIKNMAERKGLTFDVHIPESAIVTGDDNMITAVVRNILTNAIKFTAKGGTIRLDITPSNSPERGENSLPSKRLGEAFTVSVADTGMGMNSEQLQNLFRIDRHHSRKGTVGELGSGLGLVVCKELLEKHGSKLQVESVEGKGSKFWFEI